MLFDLRDAEGLQPRGDLGGDVGVLAVQDVLPGVDDGECIYKKILKH